MAEVEVVSGPSPEASRVMRSARPVLKLLIRSRLSLGADVDDDEGVIMYVFRGEPDGDVSMNVIRDIVKPHVLSMHSL